MKKQYWFIAFALAVVGVIMFYVRKSRGTATVKDPDKKPDTPASNAPCNTSGNNQKAQFPLKQGSRGLEVKQLQRYLNKNHNSGLCADGIWGPKTQEAFAKARISVPFGATFTTELPEIVFRQLFMQNY